MHGSKIPWKWQLIASQGFIEGEGEPPPPPPLRKSPPPPPPPPIPRWFLKHKQQQSDTCCSKKGFKVTKNLCILAVKTLGIAIGTSCCLGERQRVPRPPLFLYKTLHLQRGSSVDTTTYCIITMETAASPLHPQRSREQCQTKLWHHYHGNSSPLRELPC